MHTFSFAAHREVFSVSGVSSSKLQVIEESLDTTLYDPETTVPLPLDPLYGNSFKFLSVFKWEARKGWDVLLQAYFEVFNVYYVDFIITYHECRSLLEAQTKLFLFCKLTCMAKEIQGIGLLYYHCILFISINVL